MKEYALTYLFLRNKQFFQKNAINVLPEILSFHHVNLPLGAKPRGIMSEIKAISKGRDPIWLK